LECEKASGTAAQKKNHARHRRRGDHLLVHEKTRGGDEVNHQSNLAGQKGNKGGKVKERWFLSRGKTRDRHRKREGKA